LKSDIWDNEEKKISIELCLQASVYSERISYGNLN